MSEDEGEEYEEGSGLSDYGDGENDLSDEEGDKDEDLEEEGDGKLVKKVRTITRLFRHSAIKNDLLANTCATEYNGKKLVLIRDVKTRWGSTLKML